MTFLNKIIAVWTVSTLTFGVFVFATIDPATGFSKIGAYPHYIFLAVVLGATLLATKKFHISYNKGLMYPIFCYIAAMLMIVGAVLTILWKGSNYRYFVAMSALLGAIWAILLTTHNEEKPVPSYKLSTFFILAPMLISLLLYTERPASSKHILITLQLLAVVAAVWFSNKLLRSVYIWDSKGILPASAFTSYLCFLVIAVKWAFQLFTGTFNGADIGVDFILLGYGVLAFGFTVNI